jgi:hypothetical protein
MKLPRFEIHPQKTKGSDEKKICTTIDCIAYPNLNINGFERKIFLYIVSRQEYDIILKEQSMEITELI